MISKYQYALKKLFEAVDTLVVGTGGIQERLYIAYSNDLCLLREPNDLPDVLYSGYKQIMEEILTKRDLREKSLEDKENVQEGIIPMTDDRASSIARDIFLTYLVLDELENKNTVSHLGK